MRLNNSPKRNTATLVMMKVQGSSPGYGCTSLVCLSAEVEPPEGRVGGGHMGCTYWKVDRRQGFIRKTNFQLNILTRQRVAPNV